MFAQLFRSAAVVSIFTLISRILGMVRDITLAVFMGSGVFADVFFVAFRIPNLFRRIFGEGAFNSAFVPVLNEEIEKGDAQQVQHFINLVSGLLLTGLLVTVIAGIIGARYVVYLVAPGFIDEVEKVTLTTAALRWTFPYLMFISLVAMAAGIFNSYQRFAVPAFTPILLNVVLILTAIVILPWYADASRAMAIGVFIAGLTQFLFQIPFLRALKRLPKPRLKGWRHHKGVRKVFRLMAPAIIGASAGQINLIINTILASFLVTGSVSWLYYSDRLMEFPVGILAIAVGTVILPTLSKSYANEDEKSYGDVLDWALRIALLLGLPAAVGLGLLALPLLSTLFAYGEFSAHDATMASLSLAVFAFAVPAFVLVKVLAPAYFARQDTQSPVRYAITSMGINVLCGIVLSPHFAHVGLAAALMISANINMLLLLYFLLRRQWYRPREGWLRFGLSVTVALGIMALVIIFLRGDNAIWLANNMWQRVSRLSSIIVLAVLSYTMVLFVCGIRPRQFIT